MTSQLTDEEILQVAMKHCEFTPEGTYHLRRYQGWAIVKVVRECVEAMTDKPAASPALEDCVGALGDACHATAIYGDQPPQLYLDALDAARRALALKEE